MRAACVRGSRGAVFRAWEMFLVSSPDRPRRKSPKSSEIELAQKIERVATPSVLITCFRTINSFFNPNTLPHP